jgi:hypothetical protein
MLFNLEIDNKQYSIDLSPELRVSITRHLLSLYKEYLAANPSENIDFEAFLVLVEKSPHPENEPQDNDDEDEDYDDELQRKDKIIDGLLELIKAVK